MELLITCICLIIAFCTAFISYFFYTINKKYLQYILKNSIALNNLFNLNKEYKFYTKIDYFNEQHTYDNKNFYNNISCEDYLIYQLQFKKYKIVEQINFVCSNRIKYNSYCKRLSTLKQFGNFIQPNNKLNIHRLISKEKALFDKNILKPIINFNIPVHLYCSKINGSIYMRKHQTFSLEHISLLIDRLNDKNGTFYNDRGIWDAICRVERGKVSNKMRFSIYKRDGYRCRFCGRSDKFENLEIDHIKPIAKGGKSTYDNLQTLCSTCNKNKSDNY